VARLRIGTSGWSYREWRGLVYPDQLPSSRWLKHYATLFDTVEVNASFYRLLRHADTRQWHAGTPDGFEFALKGSRFITHFLKLRDCGPALERYFAPLEPLADKIGPIVFQTALQFEANPERLQAFLALLPHSQRFAFEFRHSSWHTPRVRRLLREKNVAFVPFEIAALRGPRVVTADFVYVRLHGRKPGYKGDYSRQALAPWAEWLRRQIRRGRDAYVFFDNTAERDAAVRNARMLREMVIDGRKRSGATRRSASFTCPPCSGETSHSLRKSRSGRASFVEPAGPTARRRRTASALSR
jgi:uncharacterized protein YecE (DUF72 family)